MHAHGVHRAKLFFIVCKGKGKKWTRLMRRQAMRRMGGGSKDKDEFHLSKSCHKDSIPEGCLTWTKRLKTLFWGEKRGVIRVKRQASEVEEDRKGFKKSCNSPCLFSIFSILIFQFFIKYHIHSSISSFPSPFLLLLTYWYPLLYIPKLHHARRSFPECEASRLGLLKLSWWDAWACSHCSHCQLVSSSLWAIVSCSQEQRKGRPSSDLWQSDTCW